MPVQPSAEVQEQLARIFRSPQFRESPRLQAFLRFVVSLTVEGRPDEIKESTIAGEVFGRTGALDDSIVRSAARRLRARLAEYYQGEGAGDRLYIGIPKGSYVPEIRERPPASPEDAAASFREPHKRTLAPWWVMVAGLGAILVVSVVAVLWARRSEASRPSREAQELYLKGRYYWSKRTPEDLDRAVDYFTQAVVKDPRYAQAYVGLADTYNLLSEYTATPYEEAFKRAIAAARTAIQVDDRVPEAHNSLAFASFYGAWDAATAEQEFKRALELNPNYSLAHHWYATMLMSVAREHEALAQIEAAQRLDPSSKSILADKGLILLWAGDAGGAQALLEELAASDPQFASPHRYLANVYLLEKRYRDYLAELKQDAVLSKRPVNLAIAEAGEKGLAANGAAGMLEAMKRTTEQSASYEATHYFWLAQMNTLAGDKREAIRYLELAFGKHDVRMVTLTADPLLAYLREDAAFKNLVSRVGVVR